MFLGVRGPNRSGMKIDETAAGDKIANGAAINPADASSPLHRLVILAEELGETQLAEEARKILDRASEGRFYVVCVGQSKRGKSTLINALVGEVILPSGYVPVTSVPTVVRFGESPEARVQFSNTAWQTIALKDLPQYVSEEFNPENIKSVSGAEVFFPSPLLATGLCLVDTPGLGSVFEGNTAATRSFIPHTDAVLVVLGADPPLAGEELSIVEALARQTQHLVFVLNKADKSEEDERTASLAFSSQLLERHLRRPVDALYQVSSLERLQNRGPERDWGRLVEALYHLARESGRGLIQRACERGCVRIFEHLQVSTIEKRGALVRPLEESARRIETMNQARSDAGISLSELRLRLIVEQNRLSDLCTARRKEFLGLALPLAIQDLEEALKAIPPSFGPRYRRVLMQEAQEIVRRRVLPWLEVEQKAAEKGYLEISRRFVDMGNDVLARLAACGMYGLTSMPHALDIEAAFSSRSKFIFRDFIEIAQPASPLRWLGDAFLGLAGAHGLIVRDSREFTIRLMEVNSSRVQSDVLHRVEESRSFLEANIRRLLNEICRIAEQALDHARSVLEEGENTRQAELARLETLEIQLRNLLPKTSPLPATAAEAN